MRCSLVSLVSRTSRSSAVQDNRPRRFKRCRQLLALTGFAVSAAIAGMAHADGGMIYSGVALNNPALPPALTADEHLLLWSHESRLRKQAIDALGVLNEAPDHGLPPERYALNQLTSLSKDLANHDSERLFNELLTAAIETYSIDLLQGLQPSAFKDRRDPKHRKTTGITVSSQLRAAVLKGLHRSIATNRVRKFVNSIEPAHNDYKTLQHALKHYRALAANGGWPEVPRSKAGKMLKPGASDPRIPALRARLEITDPEAFPAQTLDTAIDMQLYDNDLEQAVIAFQTRHGLKPDGHVGKNTRAALNVSAEERVRQLELNLDRWRLMPKVMPANHIWVNVPQYEMKLQLDRKEVLEMRVVVGKSKWPTPMMHDQLEHVVFSPYWYPPRSIAVREILPKLKADSGYLQEQRFEVLENNSPIDATNINWNDINAGNLAYRFRQLPGKGNSLGNVKFMFPNSYAVYLHDTQAKSLFDKPMRAFSHGCVRVENPDMLASALLDWDRGWKPEKVSKAMASGKQKYVKLAQTVPVYLVYFTATVKDGTVKFHQDIYGHDAHHKAQQSKLVNTQVAQILARYKDSLAATPHEPSATHSKDASTRTVSFVPAISGDAKPVEHSAVL